MIEATMAPDWVVARYDFAAALVKYHRSKRPGADDYAALMAWEHVAFELDILTQNYARSIEMEANIARVLKREKDADNQDAEREGS
ncbi:unnamed protein product [marine sediment metagenome]|uniref:Uncharacterized protein n=1 Tax=marine sediment metagenome TaxID=412755 RepID=X0XJY8_9ZZZZ